MADLDQKLQEYARGQVEVPPVRAELSPRARWYTLVSVDDHVLEPPDVFAGRMSTHFGDRAPHVVRDDDGNDHWVIDGDSFPLMGADAIITWEPEERYLGPVNYEQVRRATWDIHARIGDMDLAGIAASLNFPSAPWGFAGQRFLRLADRDLGLAAVRAYNDWVLESWAGPYPDRIIPCQLAWLADPQLAAAEIEANAARGFKAVSFTENPEKLGLPSLYSGEWDPFFQACQATGTVVNLHVGSSSETLVPSLDSPPEVLGVLFPVNAFAACTDWLYAKIPLRFPDLRIAMSESGIGWVPLMLDRLRYISRFGSAWDEPEPIEEIFHRNFWLSTFFDPSTYAQRDQIGVDRIMLESDYPHFDSSWPNTQAIVHEQIAGLPADEIAAVTHENALRLYRHDLARMPVG